MSGEFSREALRKRVGAHVFEYATRAAAQAPAPSPELVERLRLVFAPALQRIESRRRPAKRPASRAA